MFDMKITFGVKVNKMLYPCDVTNDALVVYLRCGSILCKIKLSSDSPK